MPTLPKIYRPVAGSTLFWPKLLLGMGIIVYYFCIKDLFTGAVQQFPGPKIHNNISECKGQTSYELELFGQLQVKITDFRITGKVIVAV